MIRLFIYLLSCTIILNIKVLATFVFYKSIDEKKKLIVQVINHYLSVVGLSIFETCYTTSLQCLIFIMFEQDLLDFECVIIPANCLYLYTMISSCILKLLFIYKISDLQFVETRASS